MDFSVRGGVGSTPATARIVLFATEDSSWTQIQISYLISSRSDLYLGSFIADGFYFQNSNPTQIALTYSLNNWKSTTGQITAVVEFAGIRTTTYNPLVLSFLNISTNSQTGVISLIVNTNAPF